MMAADETVAAPWRVLIVDDEENLNWSLVTSLRKDGYIVDGAHTGEEALARLQAAPYDCVVSDIKMPGMDGFELLQWLRQYRPTARVVMMTSFGSPSARQDALRDGAVAYFEKPFDLRALKDQLRRMAQAPAPAAAASEAGYDLLDVVQVISLARRDAALEVRSDGYAGALRFRQGELVWAEAGDLRGDVAFLALCVPRGGRAQLVPWNGFTDRNVTQPVARLIYAALARREGRGTAAARLASDPPVVAEPPVVAAPDAVSVSALGASPSGPPTVELPAPTPVPVAATTQPAANRWSTELRDPDLPADVMPRARTFPPPVAAGQVSGDPSAALEALARALPVPCGVVWIGTDAGLLWQRWRGQTEIPQEALTQLHMAVRTAVQAAALGDLGALGELRIVATERQIILRRGPQGGTLLLSLAPDADTSAVAATLRATLGTTAG